MKSFGLGLFLILSLLGHARAEEGFWPVNMVPTDYIGQVYGIPLSEAFLKRVMLSSVRFNNGGSGAIISKDGLVTTNFHVARGLMAAIPEKGKEIVFGGFTADDRKDEIKLIGAELNQLTEVVDITAEMQKYVTPEMSALERTYALRRAEIEISKGNTKDDIRGDVISLYRGTKFLLYKYKRYTDVRLVHTPEQAIGEFGGDTDNFEYPRYTADWTIVRIYENDKPVDTSGKHFAASTSSKDMQDGRFMMVAGNPGSTQRTDLSSTLKFDRDTTIPTMIALLESRESALLEFSKLGEDQKQRASATLTSIQNSLKVYRARRDFLGSTPFINILQLEEDAFIGRANDKVPTDQLEARATTEKLYAESAQTLPERIFTESIFGVASALTAAAMQLSHMAEENQKPDYLRMPDFESFRRNILANKLTGSVEFYPDLEAFKIRASLNYMVTKLGQNHPYVQTVLTGKTVDQLAEELSKTELKSAAVRKQLFDNPESFATFKDPLVDLVNRIRPHWKAAYERSLERSAKISLAYNQWQSAVTRVDGLTKAPEANFSLRVSTGQVRGYVEPDRVVKPWTTIGETFSHADKHENKGEFLLPPSWEKMRAAWALDETPFNFVFFADSIGGNSGSPVLTYNPSNPDVPMFMGNLFDGNRYSNRGANYGRYMDGTIDPTGKMVRSVSTACHAMLKTLGTIYQAPNLVREIEGAGL